MLKKLVILSSVLLLGLTACNKRNKQSVSESNSDVESEPVSFDESEPVPIDENATLNDFVNAFKESRPTKIITNITFNVPNSKVVLHFNSTLIIEYSSMIKSCYSYSYEKLNEIQTGKEQMVSLVNGTSYSNGSSVYDGVEWINTVEKTTVLSSVTLSENYASLEVNEGILTGSVINSKTEQFFGYDYGVTDVHLRASLNTDKNVSKLSLSYNSYVESMRKDAQVISESIYSYNQETIEIPN